MTFPQRTINPKFLAWPCPSGLNLQQNSTCSHTKKKQTQLHGSTQIQASTWPVASIHSPPAVGSADLFPLPSSIFLANERKNFWSSRLLWTPSSLTCPAFPRSCWGSRPWLGRLKGVWDVGNHPPFETPGIIISKLFDLPFQWLMASIKIIKSEFIRDFSIYVSIQHTDFHRLSAIFRYPKGKFHGTPRVPRYPTLPWTLGSQRGTPLWIFMKINNECGSKFRKSDVFLQMDRFICSLPGSYHP